jgi:hypothetical protein
MGLDHLDKSPTCSKVYFCSSFDRYGVMPSINAIFTAFMGSLWASLYLRWTNRFREQTADLEVGENYLTPKYGNVMDES